MTRRVPFRPFVSIFFSSLFRQLTPSSIEEIGREFDDRHSTVLHGIDKIDEMRRSDEASNHTIMRLVDVSAPEPIRNKLHTNLLGLKEPAATLPNTFLDSLSYLS